jgi:hypothetical protein
MELIYPNNYLNFILTEQLVVSNPLAPYERDQASRRRRDRDERVGSWNRFRWELESVCFKSKQECVNYISRSIKPFVKESLNCGYKYGHGISDRVQ